jgi:hypothetical protein
MKAHAAIMLTWWCALGAPYAHAQDEPTLPSIKSEPKVVDDDGLISEVPNRTSETDASDAEPLPRDRSAADATVVNDEEPVADEPVAEAPVAAEPVAEGPVAEPVTSVVAATEASLSTNVPPAPPPFVSGPPRPVPRDVLEPEPDFDSFSHGFRLGYLYLVNHDCSLEGTDAESCVNTEEVFDVKRPHFFVLGYELTQRIEGSSWLNVLFVENILLAGLEQSLFLPSLNTLLGFELYQQVQLGVGVNLAPTKYKTAHIIMAIGWTPKVGNINVPIHFAFIPDVDSQHRMAATTGVNW